MTFAILPHSGLHFPSKFEWFSLWILPKFSVIPLLGSQLRLIPPFVLLKIKWPPPPTQAINNDRSLSFVSFTCLRQCSHYTGTKIIPDTKEVNIQERGLGSSSPNPLAQPLPHGVRCAWTACSSSRPLLFILYQMAVRVDIVWKAYP